MTESLTAAAACGNPVHFEGTEKDVCSLLKMLGKETGFVEHLGKKKKKMTVKQYLQFFAGLSGTEKRLNSAIEQMHLAGLMKKRLSKCTDGEKKRVRIAREITKGAEDYFILNPIAFEDENSKKIILGWMETFWFSTMKLIASST